MSDIFSPLRNEIGRIKPSYPIGRVSEIRGGLVSVGGLSKQAVLGDQVRFGGAARIGEVISLRHGAAEIMAESGGNGLAIGDEVILLGPAEISPDESWKGRVIDPFGQPLDGKPLFRGAISKPVVAPPPKAAERHRLGARLGTGTACFDTVLPLVQGQRIGLFAGSGVGKSNLLSQFARGVEADVVVIALIGERGRELREFVETTLDEKGLRRSIVVAATSDQSAQVRRQCVQSALAVAEYFRDAGQHVLFLADSVTRFAEAHREIALAAGEQPSLRGYPPSVQSAIMSMAERAGPGPTGAGDITAVFSVLVAGSDMEEPVADILRGVLDGHVVMDRKIAERGRFPAIDLLRSVSRSLPWAATEDENLLITEMRKIIAAWENAELMIQAGLYRNGSDPMIDRAIRIWPQLDQFLSLASPAGEVQGSFDLLKSILHGPKP